MTARPRRRPAQSSAGSISPPRAGPDLVTSPARHAFWHQPRRPPALLPLMTGTSSAPRVADRDERGARNLTADGLNRPARAHRARERAQRGDGGERGPARDRRGARLSADAVDHDGHRRAQPVNGAARSCSRKCPGFRAVTVADAPRAATAQRDVGRRSAQWWVTWIDQRQKAMLRRVAADGERARRGARVGDGAAATGAIGRHRLRPTTAASAGAPSRTCCRTVNRSTDRAGLQA